MIESGDYISREAAIEAMYKDAEAHPGHIFWVTQHEALMDIPAADVRPVVRGKWIGTHDGFYYSYSCSECGYEALYKENTKDQVCSEFCPNCGARMGES